ncbi:type 4a pilus biogenesis protein PilO [Vibrio nitrifigilis]|uniref:Type 4a pilus biogenesis protein PilO n=1 Tax=Vibrio nitrifigilis TaxID=2789781 RepID=A0ABS0GG60_9VIBR|nr:type 4a pilus biogenesis protein PilO [Vibrio nitrifigilis]MBF9001347.1 type 4a pilus biogenesis protein PilO [Vibrio nitrifigilis]
MKERWLVLSEHFANRSMREKVLIVLSGLVVICLLIQTVLIDPLFQKNKLIEQRIAEATRVNRGLVSEINLLQKQLSANPDIEVDKQFDSLQQQSQQLSMTISQVIDGMVSPSQMAKLLESVLANGKKLNLVSLTSLPAKPVGTNKADNNYYIHPVRIELTGQYFAIQSYLSALESLPVKYYWHSLKYTVEDYPQARLILVVYTIGSREEFIGG